MYLWIKALHVVFMVTWFAGLFYLPRLFVYHASTHDSDGSERFKVMERKLFFGITTPGAILTIGFGLFLVGLNGLSWPAQHSWFQCKLLLVAILIAYHVYLGYLVNVFRHDRNTRSHVYYRWINELPVFLLIGIVILAIVKPNLW